jgi:hypothetical protein
VRIENVLDDSNREHAWLIRISFEEWQAMGAHQREVIVSALTLLAACMGVKIEGVAYPGGLPV